jgi:hypothetical protein
LVVQLKVGDLTEEEAAKLAKGESTFIELSDHGHLPSSSLVRADTPNIWLIII